MTVRWMIRGTTAVSMNFSRVLGTGTELPFTTRFRCLMENLGLAGHCQPVTLHSTSPSDWQKLTKRVLRYCKLESDMNRHSKLFLYQHWARWACHRLSSKIPFFSQFMSDSLATQTHLERLSQSGRGSHLHRSSLAG